jgi:hypothetical protein
MSTKAPTPGERAHWLVTGQTFATGESSGTRGAISQRGATFTISSALISANTDRLNNSWVTLLHDEAGQIAKWGRVVFAPGPAPADLTKWSPGTVEQVLARDDAHRLAMLIPDVVERQRALREVSRTFGALPSTQVSVELHGGRFA